MALSAGEAAYVIERRIGDEPESERIGRLTLESDGTLKLLDADEDYRDVLQEIVAAINAEPAIRVKVPPPDPEGRGVYFQQVARTDPEFPSLLGDYLDQKYDLVLVPPEEPDVEDEP